MRINNVGPQVVIPSGVRDSVDGVRATEPIGSPSASAYSGGRILVEQMEVQPAPVVIQERRELQRRGVDRRKQQLPVLIDTRVAERRVSRRRGDDAAPPAIDVEA